MKRTIRILGIIALVAVIGFSMIACDDGGGGGPGGGPGGGDPELSGTVSIVDSQENPITTAKTGDTLTASYTGSEASNPPYYTYYTYQWKKDGTNVPYGTYPSSGVDSIYSVSAGPGSYTVTVSLAGYQSKTSAPVAVSWKYPVTGVKIVNPSGINYPEITTLALSLSSDAYGKQIAAAVSPYNANVLNITWSSSDQSVIEGTPSGSQSDTGQNHTRFYAYIKPLKIGTATITVTTADGNKTATCAVTVFAPVVWTAVSDSTFGTDEINDIAYGDGKFVAVSSKKATSTDGITWIVDEYSESGYCIAYGNGIFVVGQRDTIAYSPSWHTVTLYSIFNKSVYNVKEIAYGNGIFVAANIDTDYKVATSTDGQYWKSVDINIFNPIAYGNDIFVTRIGRYNMAYSSDGRTWAYVDSPFSVGTSSISAIAYGNGMFVAMIKDYMFAEMAYSYDGKTWTLLEDVDYSSGDIRAIAYGNDMFVAVGTTGLMAYSQDGITWTFAQNNIFGTSTIRAIAYGNGTFVAVGADGKMAYWKPDN